MKILAYPFGEKRQILATFNTEVKNILVSSVTDEDYLSAISVKTDDNNRVIIDFDIDPNNYCDLDKLININPKQLSNEDRETLLHICEICPDIKINDDIGLTFSTAKEYKNSEQWITSTIQKINPEWSDIQKIAFIDNAIGKKISYSPDFDTESFSPEDSRALWKIIDSGYGVCNGITQIEQYILNRIGIETEIVASDVHSFLKLNNIELPTSNGEMIKGNTLLDPTWNLASQRYGAKPENFCISYEEIRKHDIKDNGEDSLSHKNDDVLTRRKLKFRCTKFEANIYKYWNC